MKGVGCKSPPCLTCLARLLPPKRRDGVLPVLLRRQRRSSARSEHALLFQEVGRTQLGDREPGRRAAGGHDAGAWSDVCNSGTQTACTE